MKRKTFSLIDFLTPQLPPEPVGGRRVSECCYAHNKLNIESKFSHASGKLFSVAGKNL